MHSACNELINTINAYIQKADEKLSDALEKAGFVEPKETVEHIEKLEEQLAEIFEEQSAEVQELLKKAEENGLELEETVNTQWKDFKSADTIKEKLFHIFVGTFSEYIPELSNIYISKLDSELVVTQITEKTTDWIASWSDELSELMKLSSHEEIESVLDSAFRSGKSIDKLSREILQNGIRDEYYKARRAAITEILRAHSVAREESIQQCPAATDKEWVHTGSYRNEPRENHVKISGQVVAKNQPFTLVGKDGFTYHPQYPRDTSLPAGESINCHCIHRGIASKDVLGLSLEERKKLQQQAIDELDEEWRKEIDGENKARAGIDESRIKCDWLQNKKSVAERKAYFKSDSRWALFESGVIQNDADLEHLYKTVDTPNGKRKIFKSLTELKEDGIITVPAKTLKHSTVGDYISPSKSYPNGRLKNGGHSQKCIEELESRNISYSITEVCENGVRLGYVSEHKQKTKQSGIGQSWFPEEWDDDEILKAGTYVANISKDNDMPRFEEYNKVRVGIFLDDEGYPSTIFPDNSKQP